MGQSAFYRKKGANSVHNDLYLVTPMTRIGRAAEFFMTEAKICNEMINELYESRFFHAVIDYTVLEIDVLR